MKTAKRLFAFLLCLMLVSSLFPSMALAEEPTQGETQETEAFRTDGDPVQNSTIIASGSCGDYGLKWTLDSEGTLTISGVREMRNFNTSAPWSQYTAQIKRVVIQSGATSIGKYAFEGCTELGSVSIPSTVTRIGERAFEQCSKLGSITIPSSVTEIGAGAFIECKSLKTVTIPDSVTTLGEGMFLGCDNLQNVTLPSAMTSIPGQFFEGCSELTSISFPEGLVSIGRQAFYECKSLKSVVFPVSVASIGGEAFDQCTALSELQFYGNAPVLDASTFQGVVAEAYYPALDPTWANMVSPSSPLGYNSKIVWIPRYSYDPEAQIASGSCGDNLFWTIYGSGTIVISGTGKMKNYYLDNSPWNKYSRSLKKIEIQSGVTSIGNYAFKNCLRVEEALIPDSVTRIGEDAFWGCSMLSSIELPPRLTAIEDSAFIWCSGLSSVTIPARVKTIDSKAFYGCSGLLSVIFPEGVTSIGYQSFDNCTSLSWVMIPASVTEIGGFAFDSCDSLTDVYFGGTEQAWEKLGIQGGNSALQNAVVHFNYSAPAIKTQPKSVTASEGSTAYFSVVANGAELRYQWQWSNDGGKTWRDSTSAAAGCNTDTLQVASSMTRNSYRYRCVVENRLGKLTSDAAVLTVVRTPVITAQPKSVTVSEGGTAKFTVTATGTGLSYQWQWSADGGKTWKDSSSATAGYNTATLQVSAAVSRNGYKYRCKVSNSYGSETSDAATLTVDPKPCITAQPKSVTVSEGGTAKFTVTATGTGLSYQWQWSADGGKTWKDSSSATVGYNTATLQVSATVSRDGYKYRCKVSNSYGSVTSDAATLTVLTKPAITTQPKSVSVTEGTTAKFTVTASGSSLSYQWQWSADKGATWKDSSSATAGYNTATLKVTATAARNGYQYRCKVTNSAGSVTSNAATLTVLTKPAITTQPKNVSAAEGTTAKFTVTASGSNPSYQWQWSADKGATWKNSSSATTGYNTATLKVTATAARNGYQYRCKVTNSVGSVTSNAVTLTVGTKPTITKHPQSVTMSDGDLAVFSVTAGGEGLSYQWQYRTGSTGTWKDCTSGAGCNSKNFAVDVYSYRNGYQYRCAVTNSFGTTYSNPATLKVN